MSYYKENNSSHSWLKVEFFTIKSKHTHVNLTSVLEMQVLRITMICINTSVHVNNCLTSALHTEGPNNYRLGAETIKKFTQTKSLLHSVIYQASFHNFFTFVRWLNTVARSQEVQLSSESDFNWNWVAKSSILFHESQLLFLPYKSVFTCKVLELNVSLDFSQHLCKCKTAAIQSLVQFCSNSSQFGLWNQIRVFQRQFFVTVWLWTLFFYPWADL